MSNTRTTATLVAAGAAAAGLGYAWTIVTGRLVSTAEYSDFSAAASIIYFAVTALAPLSQTVAYFTATFVAQGRDDAAAALERRILHVVLTAGALLSIAGVVGAVLVARALRLRSPADVVLVALSIVFVGALHVRRGAQLGRLSFGRYSWNLTVESAVRIVLVCALLLKLPNAPASLAAYLLSAVFALLLAGRWPRAGKAATDLTPIRRYFVRALMYTAIYAGFQNLDVLFVKRLFAPTEAGTYGAASFLARAAGMLVMPFYALAVPHLVEVISDRAEVRRRFVRICGQYVLLSAITVAILGGGSGAIVTTLFGAAYIRSAALLLPLSIAAALSGLVFLICQLPVAMNRFAFVGAYAAGLGVEIVLLAARHRTLREVAFALVAANAITLLLLVPFLRLSRG